MIIGKKRAYDISCLDENGAVSLMAGKKGKKGGERERERDRERNKEKESERERERERSGVRRASNKR